MVVSNFIIMPLFLAAFVISFLQYLVRKPKRFLVNAQVGLMAGAFVLMIANVATGGAYSWTFLVLGLLWLGTAVTLQVVRVPAAK
jgi:hypothetical protein